MPNKNNLRRFVDGGAPALLRHIFGVLAVLAATVVAGTLIYAEVKSTSRMTKDNRVLVEAIEDKINEVTMQQRLLLQRTEDEKDLNREFRRETGRALSEILLRLPRSARPTR